jgi:hypothetical protein
MNTSKVKISFYCLKLSQCLEHQSTRCQVLITSIYFIHCHRNFHELSHLFWLLLHNSLSSFDSTILTSLLTISTCILRMKTERIHVESFTMNSRHLNGKALWEDNSLTMKITILLGGALHYTNPSLLDARLNSWKMINMASPKFKIQDSEL